MKKEDLLIDAIIKYILPISNKKAKKSAKHSKLEELLKKEKSKPLDFISDLVNEFLNKDSKNQAKKAETLEIPEILESKKPKSDEEEIRYSIALERKKEEKSSFGYRVEITYEETEIEERLSVKVTFEDGPLGNYSINKNTLNQKNNSTLNINNKNNHNEKIKNNDYSITIKKDKENKTKDNYSVNIVYENNYEKERLSINYRSTLGAYLNKRLDSLTNFEDRVPGKHVDVHPASMMGGVLGFTYLGQDRMALRDDLISMKRMVDIHESIHTPDEYETRVLTDWIMSKPRMKYFK